MRQISTNPGSTEVGEYGLTRGTCFVARRPEAVAVAGLLWISWCVLGGAGLLRWCSRYKKGVSSWGFASRETGARSSESRRNMPSCV